MSEYQCPFCGKHQAITDPKSDYQTHRFDIENNVEGEIGVSFRILSCANPLCKKTMVILAVGPVEWNGGYRLKNGAATLFSSRIIPHGAGKEFPDVIPAPILEDYKEACLIRDLSPKASATLVRRCLQGMIRDFCNIRMNRLVDEIEQLKKLVDSDAAPKGVSIETVEAIDHTRGLGNIGAHMEKDIDHIIPVAPGDANSLIELVEMLFEEWYIARDRRQKRLALIKGTADEKKAIKAGKKGGSADS